MTEFSLSELIHRLDSLDEDTRLHAVESFALIGEDAAHAIPALVDTLGDSSNRVSDAAFSAIQNIGVAAIPYLVMILHSTERDEKRRAFAAEALAMLGPISLPSLLDAMNGGDDTSRLAAIDAIPLIGPAAENAVPRLAELLNEPGWADVTATALAKIAAKASVTGESPAWRTLLYAGTTGPVSIRREVTRAYEFLTDKAKEILPVIRAAMQDSDNVVREHAARVIKRLEGGGSI